MDKFDNFLKYDSKPFVRIVADSFFVDLLIKLQLPNILFDCIYHFNDADGKGGANSTTLYSAIIYNNES